MSFDGARIEKMAPHRIFRLGLARTFQKEASFANLTVEQNVRLAAAFGAGLAAARATARSMTRWTCRSGRRERAAAAAHRLRHQAADAGFGHRHPPKLLMLDEPASGLNAAELGDLQR